MNEEKILKDVKNYLLEDLSSYTSTIQKELDSLKEQGIAVNEIIYAGALLKILEDQKDEEKVNRSGDEEKMTFAKIEDSQRFFINIGAVDGVTDHDLIHFVSKYVEGITQDDFADAYVKGTFSFFETKKEFADAIMNALNGQTYGKREVHVELANAKPEGGHNHSHSDHRDSRRGGGYGRDSRRGGFGGGYGRRDSSRGGYSRDSRGSRDGGRSDRGGYSHR